jgi:Ca2+-binding EF-hand superfamily protein
MEAHFLGRCEAVIRPGPCEYSILTRYGTPVAACGMAGIRVVCERQNDGGGMLRFYAIQGASEMDVTGIGLGFDYSTLMAQRMQGAGQQPPNLEGVTQRLIQDKDKDGDGSLDAAEICISEELFNQVDANGDGKLNADELMAGAKAIGEELRAQAPQGPLPPPMNLDEATDRLIGNLDQDGDGALSSTEIPISETLFGETDTNQDGVLVADELKASAASIGKELFANRMPPRGGKRTEDDDDTDDEEQQKTLLDPIQQNLDEEYQSRLNMIL